MLLWVLAAASMVEWEQEVLQTQGDMVLLKVQVKPVGNQLTSTVFLPQSKALFPVLVSL